MAHRVEAVWDDTLLGYNFGASHPMAPARVDLAMRLAQELGILDFLDIVTAPMADEATLLLAHDLAYVDAVRDAGAAPERADESRGLGTDDNPAFRGMHEASSRVVGATVQCAERVWRGDVDTAVNVTGGLHHGMRNRASGFCIYNDVTAAIARLLELGAERVAYVDVDAHHGDGVQAAFYDDPRVLTVSVHESPLSLFPGTGFPYEAGRGAGEGYSVNLALPAGTADAAYLRAFSAVVPHVVDVFKPQVLVSQHGCDSHVSDPLTHLALSIDAQRAVYLAIASLSRTAAGGRWVATGGGGYDVVDVVPRAWAHLLAIAAGRPLDPATPTPQGWRDYVRTSLGRLAPARMTDGCDAAFTDWSAGYDPADPVDRAVMATRRAVFPALGLDIDL